MLKIAWKAEVRLKEKKTLTYSKCDECKRIDIIVAELKSKTGADAAQQRKFAQKCMADHKEKMFVERAVLDDAGLRAIVKPRTMWTFIVDGATQKNFELPKFLGRRHKSLSKCEFFKFKLMGVYSYGHSFTPFLIHDSQTAGANATWTCLWTIICRMFEEYGYWPDEMHIQLDNTTGDCKNSTTFGMAAWLVATNRCKGVRLFFLDVGHTHVVID